MKRNLKEMGFATHIDLFSNTCEPIAPLAPPTKWINEVKKDQTLKNQITVNTLSNSAINKFRDQSKEVTQTENGIIIKY
jgi:hypothetical protein